MESLQPNEASSDTDLIRSMAVSSAELWHEMLDRLTQIHESQIILARAVEELGTIVRQSMSGAPLPALDQVHKIASLPAGSLPLTVSLALGSGGMSTASVAATSTITVPDGADAVAQAQAIVDALLGLDDLGSTTSKPASVTIADHPEQPANSKTESKADAKAESKAAKAAKVEAKAAAKAASKAAHTKAAGEDIVGDKTSVETTAIDTSAVNAADPIAEPVLLVTVAEDASDSKGVATGPKPIDPTYFGIPATLGELSIEAIDSLLAAEFGDPVAASDADGDGPDASIGAADSGLLEALLGSDFVSQAPATLTVVAPQPVNAPVEPVAAAAATAAAATPPSQMLPPPLITPDVELEDESPIEPVALHVHVAAPDPAVESPPVFTLAPMSSVLPEPQSELPPFSVVAQAAAEAPPVLQVAVAPVAPAAAAPAVQFHTVTPESPGLPHVMSAASMATEILAATPEEKKPEKPVEIEEEEINQNISEDLTILATNRKKRRFHRN